MALSIKNPVTEQLAQQLAADTGESLTEAITVALRARLDSRRRTEPVERLLEEVAAIQSFLAAHQDRNALTDDEILGYDEQGIPR